jgi:hypothetical protein
MSDTVYLLWHTHTIGNDDSNKLIGVYTSELLAAEARMRMLLQPGFKECPDGFLIVLALLNKDSWEEGYFTYSY